MTVRVPRMPIVFRFLCLMAASTSGMALRIGSGDIASSSRMQKCPPIDVTAATRAAAAALSDLVLGERGEEARCRPAFLVGLLGELLPHQLDGRQAQVGEQELDAGGVDGAGRLHARPPSWVRVVPRGASSARSG